MLLSIETSMKEILEVMQTNIFVNVMLYTLLVFIYALFVWKFYKFMARKNILKLELSEYATAGQKFLAGMLFFIQYIVVMPLIVFFWFSVLSLILLILAKGQAMEQVLFISAVFIAATRISAYLSEDLAREIAKILPLTVLGVFALNPNTFAMPLTEKLKDIIIFFPNIKNYLLFIFCVEVFFRLVNSVVEEREEFEESIEYE